MLNKTFVTFIILMVVSGYGYAKLHPLKDYAALPAVLSPKLSPDGKNILSLSPINGQTTVVVSPYGSVEIAPVIMLKKGRDRIESASWLNNERILVTASYPDVVYNRKIRINRHYVVNLDGSDLRKIELGRLQRHKDANEFSDISVISSLKNDPEHILLEAYTGRDPSPAVFKYNIYTGKAEKVVSAAHEINDWVPTSQGDVYIGIRYKYDRDTDQNKITFFYRPNKNTEEWQEIYSYYSGVDSFISPVSVDVESNKLIVMTDHGAAKTILRNFDIKKRAFGDVIYEVDGYDIENVKIKGDELVGVWYTDDYDRIVYFDEELKKRQKMIKNTFSRFQSYIVSSSKDKNRVIVSASNNNSPVKYFLVDLKTKKGGFWLSRYAALENKVLPAKQAFSYKASDGFELNGYFTPGKNGASAPLVVFPHGGPTARDDMHFDIWVQMLARQGYAVLQPNFRGSSGFGNKYQISGRKQWGKLMQTDVYDAINWVKENNMADTNNMCIVGASYGGYVALTAGFQKPDEFKCVVSVNGISDIPAMIEKDNLFNFMKGSAKIYIGDLNVAEEKAYMQQSSAINFVSKFNAPTLLIASENDQRVHPDQSRDLYSALKKARKKVKYIELEDGTHFLDEPSNRLEAFVEISDFLENHLD